MTLTGFRQTEPIADVAFPPGPARPDVVLPVSANGQPRAQGGARAPSSIVYSSTVDETVVVRPYVVSLLGAAPLPQQSSQGNNGRQQLLPSLVLHDLETLAPVQTLAVPPEAADRDLDPSSSIQYTARLLSIASSSGRPPILFVTSTQPATTTATTTPSEQTLWVATMATWEAQIDELGRQGKWQDAIRLLRNATASTGRTRAPVRNPSRRRKSSSVSVSLSPGS